MRNSLSRNLVLPESRQPGVNKLGEKDFVRYIHARYIRDGCTKIGIGFPGHL